MKKQHYIFLCTFLLGMFFTVIQYFPSLKEKSFLYKTELLKKMPSEDNASDSSDVEDDVNEDNIESDMYFSGFTNPKTIQPKTCMNSNCNCLTYTSQRLSIPSPPPKV